MGCIPLHFLKACSVGSSKIKVMTVDGSCLKFEAPSLVKELLMDYPLHSLFDSETVRALGVRSPPLPSTLALQPGHLYFLVPQSPASRLHYTAPNAALSQSDPTCKPVIVASSQSELAHMRIPKCSRRKCKVSFVSTPTVASSEAARPCVQFLPSPSDSVVRVKMVVSKRQLASALRGGELDCVSMVEGLLSPLLQASRKDAASSVCNDVSGNDSWRPSLESIPEAL